jgi:streptogramin lyase
MPEAREGFPVKSPTKILVTLALVAIGLTPQPQAAADTCPAGSGDPSTSMLSPQHLVAAPNGDLDVLYSKQAASDVARVRYDYPQNRKLTAIAIVDSGGERPHRVLSDGTTNIYFSLTKTNNLGRLPAEFTNSDEASLIADSMNDICGPEGIELRQGELWVADSTIDAVHRIANPGGTPTFDYVPLGDPFDDELDPCFVQEFATATNTAQRVYFSCNDMGSVGRINPPDNDVAGPYFETDLDGSSPHAMFTGIDGKLYMTEHSDNTIARITAATPPILSECRLPGSGKNPGDIIAVDKGGGAWDLWFTQTGNDRIGHIFDVHTLDMDSEWEDCADQVADNYEQFALSYHADPKGIAFNDVDDRVWFTEAETDSVGWIDPSSEVIVECPLPTSTGTGNATDCHFPDPDPPGLMVGGGLSLLEATDELTPALDPGAEEECQAITHTLSGTLSGTVPDPDTGEPLDVTGKFELTSDVACESEGTGEDAITSAAISDPVLSFTPVELGTFGRDGSDVWTAGLHGVCKVKNLYFMCSVIVTGSWDPVDDETPDLERADVTSAILVIEAE